MLEECTQNGISAFHYRIIMQWRQEHPLPTRLTAKHSSLAMESLKTSGVLKTFSPLHSNENFSPPNKSLQPAPFVQPCVSLCLSLLLTSAPQGITIFNIQDLQPVLHHPQSRQRCDESCALPMLCLGDFPLYG